MKFVNLHSHDTFSIGDGLNYPEDHYNFIVQNAESESMALATTNHGNINSLGYMLQARDKLAKKGIKFKTIVGNEMYIHPDLDEWAEQKKNKDSGAVEETESVIENESETKDKSKWYDPIKRRHHLVVIAQNQKGLENLFKLTSWSYKNGFYRFPRVDFKRLEQYNEGLIISTACLGGLASYVILRDLDKGDEHILSSLDKELKPLLDIFGNDRAYLELQFNGLPEQKIVNNYLVKYAKHSGYKLISTADSHYAKPDFWKDREIYKLLGKQMQGWNVSFDDLPKSKEDLKCELFQKNGTQMFESYLKYNSELDSDLVKESIERTYDIAHNFIEDVKIDGSFKLPIRHNTNPSERLKELSRKMLLEKGFANNDVYVKRLEKELEVICKKDYALYFLTLKDAIEEIQKKYITGIGRGSGAGSLVCYLLDITKIDPIKNNLLFERFLSENRNEAPDIDNDVEDRTGALDVLREYFGVDNVIAISNYNTLQLKSLVKDLSKSLKIPFEEVNEVTSKMEDEAQPKILEEIGHDQKLYVFDYDNAVKYSPTFASFIEKYPQLSENIKVLFKQIKAVAKHAGGVCIVSEADKNMPLIKIRGELQTPWSEGLTVKHLEQFGLIKYDFLGLATLRIIRKCIEYILQTTNQPVTFENVSNFYNEYLLPDKIGDGEPEVFKEIYHKGKFLSIFQFTEKGVCEFVKTARPMTVSDISAITALWRPGPLAGGADKAYIEATYNPENIRYDHPVLEELLSPTKGTLLYQEQFMLLANKLAGFSLVESDELRKLLVKPVTSLGEEMKQKRIQAGEKFIAGCIKNGLSEERAKRLWYDEILGFISYGFNSAHSYSYAYISYSCAWLFHHYPIQWACAVLENESGGKAEDKQKAISLVRSFGFNVQLPDINKSKKEWFIVNENTIVAPLTFIQNVGDKAVDQIIEHQPYSKIEDILYNDEFDYRRVNKKVISALTLSGALDSIIDDRFDNNAHFFDVCVENKPKTKKKFLEYIQETKGKIQPFNNQQIFLDRCRLLGYLDIELLISKEKMDKLYELNIPSISNFDFDVSKYCWIYISNKESKVSAKGNNYVLLTCFGSNFDQHDIYMFGTENIDIQINKCAVVKIAKSIGQNRWSVYDGQIRVIE